MTYRSKLDSKRVIIILHNSKTGGSPGGSPGSRFGGCPGGSPGASDVRSAKWTFEDSNKSGIVRTTIFGSPSSWRISWDIHQRKNCG